MAILVKLVAPQMGPAFHARRLSLDIKLLKAQNS